MKSNARLDGASDSTSQNELHPSVENPHAHQTIVSDKEQNNNIDHTSLPVEPPEAPVEVSASVPHVVDSPKPQTIEPTDVSVTESMPDPPSVKAPIVPPPPAPPVPPAPPASNTPHPQEPKPESSPKKSKGLLVGVFTLLGVLLLGVGGYFVYQYITGSRVLQRSIMKPLTVKELQKKSKDIPNLYEYNAYINEVRNKLVGTPEEAMYAGITYEEMLDFLSFYNNSDEQKKLLDEGIESYSAYFNDYHERFEELKAQWSDLYNLHNPGNYVKATFHTRYTDVPSYRGTDTYPGFWVEVTFPKGEIRDCSVFIGLGRGDDQVLHPDAQTYVKLATLLDMTKESSYYWNDVKDNEQTTYDSWEIFYQVNRVELTDGTTYSVEDLSEIPAEVLAYLNDPLDEKEYQAIKVLIDPQFKGKDEYVTEYVDNQLIARSPLCYQLVKEMEEE